MLGARRNLTDVVSDMWEPEFEKKKRMCATELELSTFASSVYRVWAQYRCATETMGPAACLYPRSSSVASRILLRYRITDATLPMESFPISDHN